MIFETFGEDTGGKMIEVDQFCQSCGGHFIDEDSFYPAPWGFLNRDGQLFLFALPIEPNPLVDRAFQLCRDAKVREFFFTLDCHNRPDRQPVYHSILVIFHVLKGEAARLGVMEYGWDEERGAAVITPVRWDDPFWSTKYGDLLTRLDRQSGGLKGKGGWGRSWHQSVVLN